jgi:hypothetical protein
VNIHDWSEGPGTLSEKTVVGDEWTRYVKFHLALGNPKLPPMPDVPDYRQDFLTGVISQETESVFQGRTPIPTSAEQTVAKSPGAFNLMANRLIAVIYFD